MTRKAGLFSGTLVTTFLGSTRRGGQMRLVSGLPAGLVFDMNPAAFTPQADNTALTSALDAVSAIPFTNASSTLKYRAAGGAGPNGVSYIQCPGGTNSGLTCASANQGALATALNSQNYTIIIAAQVSSASGSCCLFGQGGGGTLHLTADGADVGLFNSSGQAAPWTATTYTSFGMVSYAAGQYKIAGAAAGSGSGALSRFFFRGLPFGSKVSSGPTIGTNTLGLGAASTLSLAFKGNIFRVLAWPRSLAAAEMMQVETVLNNLYGQTHPAVTKGKMLLFDGDSRTTYVGTTITANGGIDNGYAALLAAALGYPTGTWANYAVGGITAQNCIDKAATEIDTVAASFSSVSRRLLYEEFFNSKNLPVGNITTSGTLAYQTYQYWSARRSVFGSSDIFVAATPMSQQTTNTPMPDAWCNYLGGGNGGGGSNNWTQLPVNALIDVWADSILGGDGAYAANSSYWSDGVHLANTGQARQETIAYATCSAISGF